MNEKTFETKQMQMLRFKLSITLKMYFSSHIAKMCDILHCVYSLFKAWTGCKWSTVRLNTALFYYSCVIIPEALLCSPELSGMSFGMRCSTFSDAMVCCAKLSLSHNDVSSLDLTLLQMKKKKKKERGGGGVFLSEATLPKNGRFIMETSTKSLWD